MPNRSSTHEYHAPARSHTARVVEDLGLAIVSGRQPIGSLLPGDGDLIERYGVSRTVLREALKTLSAKGLVQAKAGTGTRVSEQSDWNLFDPNLLIWHARIGFTPAFLSHLAEMRLALEPEAAALAAHRRSDAQAAALVGFVERMGREGNSPHDFVQADLDFHLGVAEAAGNPFFLSISTLIEVALVAMLRISSPAEDVERLRFSISEHLAVAQAIEAKDAETARRTMARVVWQGVSVISSMRP
ncbi:MAG: FadR/GntR family transcriptional regulator [Devosia sp.]